jgi:hypothetical protein
MSPHRSINHKRLYSNYYNKINEIKEKEEEERV